MFSFGSKRKKAAAAAREEKRQKTLRDLREGLDAAEGIADAGEKFVALRSLDRSLAQAFREQVMLLESVPRETFRSPLTALGTGFAAGGGTLIVLGAFAPPLALGAFIGGFFGGATVGTVWDRKIHATKFRKINEENKSYIESLEALSTRTTAQLRNLIENRIDDIAASARCAEIFQSHPDIKDRFTEAAVRKLHRSGSSPKSPQTGFSL